MANKLYPTLDNLISVENLPTEFAFAQSTANNLLENTFYKNHSFFKSKHGDYATINLDIVLYKTLGFKIPGTDLAILLNSNNVGETVIPITFSYNWRILKYINLFTQDGFAGDPKAFFDILVDISGSNPEELLKQTIVDSIAGSVTDITNWIATYNSTAATVNQITVTPLPNVDNYVSSLSSALKTVGVNPTDAVFKQNVHNGSSSFQDAATKMQAIFTKWLGDFNIDNIKDFLIPKFRLSLNSINVSIQFPRDILTPVDPITFVPIGGFSLLTFNAGSLHYDSQSGFEFTNESSISLPQPSQILGTGLVLEVHKFKLDLSRTSNIPEADADGRPQDFVGVYMLDGSVSFPKSLNADATDARIYARNLLVGTGGISGFLGIEPIHYPSNPTDPPPAIKLKLGSTSAGNHFEVGLHTFDMEFKQNSIVSSDLRGYLKIPGFLGDTNAAAQIDISMHIAANGDMKITASNDIGYTIKILNAIELKIKSISVGKTGDRWYLDTSGSLKIIATIPGASSDFAANPIDITRLRIWQDGTIEFQGGGIPLPTHLSLKIGPVSLQLEHLTFGSHISRYQDIDRQYYYFGFDGSLSTGSGGVDARGDGMEFHFTRDNIAGKPFHSYLRVAGIGVDIKIPGNATKENADVYLGGYLSMRNGENPNSEPVPASGGVAARPVIVESGPTYQGSIAFNVKKLKISGKGSMLMKPKVPAWIVDVELGLSVPITLGATGLGIYGFRGLIGSHYVASKPHIGLSDEDPWYEYLKKKVPPTNKQGISIEKFDPARNGFSFGVGATIATMGDNGWTFSSKLFVMLSIPEMLLVEGQANVLHQRLGINDDTDPPFYAYLVIDSNSVQAGLGVNYNLPGSGAIMKLQGEMQLGFFFNNSSAWYLNVGKDYPVEKRVQARLFTIFNSYAYLMVNARGIKAGAGASWSLHASFGPVEAGIEAYIDTMGFISFKPVQIGGAIQMGGRIYLTVCGIGFDLGISAGLSAEAPKPFIISGFFQFRLKIFWFLKITVRIELTWRIDEHVNTEEVKLLTTDGGLNEQSPYKATHMLTEERYNLLDVGDSFVPSSKPDSEWEPYTIPMDSYIDIEFKYPVKPFTKDTSVSPTNPVKLGGGIAPVPQSTIYVSPQKARYPQVKHDLSVESVKIQIWNASSNSWVNYNPWDALTEAFTKLNISVNTANFPYGFWQYNNAPGKYTSLRLLAQSPFAMLNGTPPEQFGLLSSQLLCSGVIEKKTCQNWVGINRLFGYSASVLLRDRNLLLNFQTQKGGLGTIPNVYGIKNSLKIKAGNRVEIHFPEPVSEINIKLSSLMGYKVIGYQKKFINASTTSGLQSFTYENVYESEVYATEFVQTFNPKTILSTTHPVDKIELIAHNCDLAALNSIYTNYMAMLVDKMNLALLDNNLSVSQKNDILIWINQYTINQTDINFRILNELCPVWHDLLHDGTVNNSLTGATQYLELWVSSYCGSWWSQEFDTYILGNSGMCAQWASVMSEVEYQISIGNKEYFNFLAPYIQIWQQKYCGQSHVSGLAIYDLYNTWDKLIHSESASEAERLLLENWIAGISGFWTGSSNSFSNIKNTLCNTWANILQNFVGTNPFHKLVAQWRNEYCLGNYAPAFDKCELYIHEICWLTEKQWKFNWLLQQNNLSQITQGYTNLVNNIKDTLSPVWKPNSYFKVVIDTVDEIDSNGARSVSQAGYPYRNKIQFAFKTGLPIGFYHKQKKEFIDLDRDNKPDQFKLSSLRHYIDYQRSYPNADGKLVNAKPLYYSNPELGLFFTKTYVNEFFTTWGSYNGTPEEKFELLCRIKDPVDQSIADSAGSDREKVVGWVLHKTNPIPVDSLEFDVVSNVLLQGNPNCTNIRTSVLPPTTSAVVSYNLVPQKLYTALFKVKHYGNSNEQPIVHSYNFETSKYASFYAHIQSVFKQNRNRWIKSQFPIKLNFSDLTSLQSVFVQILDNTLEPNDYLMTNYASFFDRVMFGLLGLKSIQAVTDVEINVIRTKELDANGNLVKRVLGILIKSPEPFNDPKLPDNIIAQTIQVLSKSGGNCLHIFSKDNSCVFITNRNLNLGLHKFIVKFNYAQYDGKTYDVTSISSMLKIYTNRI